MTQTSLWRTFVFAIAFFAALTLATTPSYGQAISGDVTGFVLDATGAGVPSATVTVENVATGVKASTTTSQTGEYRISNLLPGTYNVNVSAKGFTAASVKNLSIELNRAVTANVTLQVGSTTETVEVNAAAVQIDTTTAHVQNTFETKAAADLPTASIGLGVLNLSLLGSGVSSSGGVGAGTGPAVGGQRPRNNNFTVEGIDNNNKSVTGPLVFIPNDAVAEFTLLQNQFSPEYGHSSGGQFNSVLKSGTNQFHGTIYDYLQNRNLDAIDQSLQNQGFKKNPRFDNNRLGATFGGPIKRNKLFFFGNYEYNPIGFSGSQSAVVETPTSAGYSTLAGLPGLSATNFGIYKQYVTASPAPDGNFLLLGDGKTPITVGGSKIPLGVLPLASPAFLNQYAAVIAIDYNISEKDQLRGRYIYNKQSGIDVAATFPVFFLSLPTTYYVGTFTEYHNFTPNITNEFRLGYNRFNNTTPAGDFKFPGLDQFPNIVLNDTNVNIGPDGNAPQYTIQNLYQVTENLSWVKGRHTFKMGFDGRKYITPGTFTQRARGEYNYNSTILFLQDFTPDNLSERSLGNVVYYGDQTNLYPYFNDTFRLKPNFTINLGVRYEFTSVPYSQRLQALNHISDTPGVLVFNKPEPQYKNFAPRVGFAYSPGTSGRTSIRAGFGMAYDVLYDNIGILSLPPQLSSTVDTDPLGSATGSGPNFLKNGGILPNASVGKLSRADAIGSTSNYVPDQKLPYSIQWNLGIQHVFANNYTFEARYLGTRGVHLNVQERVNIQPRVDANNFLPTYLTAPSQAQLDSLTTTLAGIQARSNIVSQFRTAGFTNPIVEFSPIGNSSYHGLALQLDRRFTNGLSFKGAYTWSHLIDDSTADFFTTRLTPRRSENFQNLKRDKASSALDRRHRFTFVAIYDVPFMSHSSNWLAKNVLGNWEFAPIYTFESPEYATVQSSTDSNLNGDSAGDRTIINTAGTDGTSSNVTALKNSAGATVAYLALNPNARYIKAAAGALTNSGRNTLPTRRIDNVDLSIIKRFSYHERFKLELQAQMLNAFNHPQFTPGSINQITSIGTTGSGVLNYVTAGNKSFNNPEAAFASNARVIQVAAKFVF